MIKEITANEVKILFEGLFSHWDEFRKTLRLNGKGTYSLITIKKNLEHQAQIFQESIYAIGDELGGHTDETGGYKVPQDKVEEMNRRLIEFGNQTIQFEYSPIKITEEDYMDPGLMDLLYPFIEFSE